jgi:hypothetical protein
MLDMSDYEADYSLEEYDNPDMRSVFNSLLKITPTSRLQGRSSKGSKSTACPKDNGQRPLSLEDDTDREPTSFLKALLIQQKRATKSLMDTAKRIGPAAHKVVEMEKAYDAAFESDIQASLPRAGGTLQGFILLFFSISYIVLALVTTIMVNAITRSTRSALMTFATFVVLGIIIFALIVRLA